MDRMSLVFWTPPLASDADTGYIHSPSPTGNIWLSYQHLQSYAAESESWDRPDIGI